MKCFLILIGTLFIMQIILGYNAKASDIVWMKETHYVSNLEFKPNGNLLLIHGKHNGSENRRGVIIINTSGDTIKQIYNSEGLQFRKNQGIWDANFSRDGRFLATLWEYDKDNLSHGRIEIFDTDSWESVKKIDIVGDAFSLLASKVLLSPNNQLVVITSPSGFYFYNFTSGQLINHLQNYGQSLDSYPYMSVFSKDGNHIYFTSTDGRLRFLNTQTYEVDFSYNAGYGNLAISENGSMIAFKTGLTGKAVEVMNIDSKEIIQTIRGFANGVNGITFSHDNQYLAVVFNYEGNLKIYKIPSGDSIYNYTTVPPGFGLVGVSISSDQKYIVSSSGYLFLYRFLPTTGVENNPVKKENIIYPNPSNSNSITLEFNLPNSGITKIQIYDLSGRVVKNVGNEFLDAGNHNYEIDISKLPSGQYNLTIETSTGITSHKILVSR